MAIFNSYVTNYQRVPTKLGDLSYMYAPWCWYIYLQNWVIYVGQTWNIYMIYG